MALENHHDQVPDSPTNTFASLNELQKDADLTLSDGSLFVTFGGVGGVGSTFFISSGIYYWEIYYKLRSLQLMYNTG